MQDQEIDAIRALVADAEKQQSDAEGFTRLLADDVALVNFGGRRVLGREAVHEAMRVALETPMAQVDTRNELVDVRFLRPDVAVASCIKYISDERPAGDEPGPMPTRGALTFVLVKQRDAWRIAVAQTTPIAAP